MHLLGISHHPTCVFRRLNVLASWTSWVMLRQPGRPTRRARVYVIRNYDIIWYVIMNHHKLYDFTYLYIYIHMYWDSSLIVWAVCTQIHNILPVYEMRVSFRMLIFSAWLCTKELSRIIFKNCKPKVHRLRYRFIVMVCYGEFNCGAGLVFCCSCYVGQFFLP